MAGPGSTGSHGNYRRCVGCAAGSEDWPAPIVPTARGRRSANTLEAGEIFYKISGGRNALGGFGHPGGEFAGPGETLRGQDGAKVRDQRFLG